MPSRIATYSQAWAQLASSCHVHDRAEFEALSHIGALEEGLRRSGSRVAMLCTSIQSVMRVLQVLDFSNRQGLAIQAGRRERRV